MTTIQQYQQEHVDHHQEEVEELDPQPISGEIWKVVVLENFKPPLLLTLDDKSDLVEHVTMFNTHMAIIRASESLKSKLMIGILKKAAQQWYMKLPHFSIIGY
jgi:hypothetical protein